MYNKDMNRIEAFISNYNPSISTNSRDPMELNQLYYYLHSTLLQNEKGI